MVNINKFTDINKELILEGKRPATGRPVLLGITKASPREYRDASRRLMEIIGDLRKQDIG